MVVIKEDTMMEQLQKFCKVRDEGHYGIPGDNATWKPNLHAHIVWDWMNHDTGKSCKLDEKAMSEMQTVLAECLEMEREGHLKGGYRQGTFGAHGLYPCQTEAGSGTC